MASGETRAASAVGARTARACDSCIRRRARWYCAADDAFLCQGCDTSVHSANLLAGRHQRVRLKAASTSAAVVGEPLPEWFCRKARTPRHSKSGLTAITSSTKLAPEPAPAPLVPDLASDDYSPEDVDDQLLCRVPIFDPFISDFCSPHSASDPEFLADDHESKPLALADVCHAHDDLPSILPSDVDLADFAADVDELLGGGLYDDAFSMEGLVESGPDDMESCFRQSGTRLKMEDEEAEDLTNCPLDRDLDFCRDMYPMNFDSGKSSMTSEEDEEKVPVGAKGVAKAEKRKVLSLKLDYKAVIAAWTSQGSPWTSGERPQVNLDDPWHDCMGGCASAVQPYGAKRSMAAQTAMGDRGREARVLRYREKRRTRLFSKKIRYEVRKLNAEKRPRMKGRFVKRASFAAPQGFAYESFSR